jgi:hypothetical protein
MEADWIGEGRGGGQGEKNGINSQTEAQKEEKSGEILKTKRDAKKYRDARSHFSFVGLWL